MDAQFLSAADLYDQTAFLLADAMNGDGGAVGLLRQIRAKAEEEDQESLLLLEVIDIVYHSAQFKDLRCITETPPIPT